MMSTRTGVFAAAFGALLVTGPVHACGWWGESVGETLPEILTIESGAANEIDLATPEGKARMGHAYRTGKGVPQDDLVARRWLSQAAEAGHAGAMNDYAMMLEAGLGGPEDQPQAARWFRAAAEAGNARAAHSLATMLFDGRGTARDPDEGGRFLRQAAEAGHAGAAADLAGRIWADEITAATPREGCLWSLIAAGLGAQGGPETCRAHTPDLSQAEIETLGQAATARLATIKDGKPQS